MYWPGHRQAGATMNTLHRSDLCKNVSVHCYLVAMVIHIQCLRSQIVCVCVCVCVVSAPLYIYIGGAETIRRLIT